MTRPIYEPSLTRRDAELGFGSDQLFRRPAPQGMNSIGPWITIANGGTTIPDSTDMPIPFFDLQYDPALVTQGEIFDWHITDTGDPGNDRFELATIAEGWYLVNLESAWDQVSTNGTEAFAYFVQLVQSHSVTWGGGSLFGDYRTSADWMRDDVGGALPGEQLGSGGQLATFTLHFQSASQYWRPKAQQTTGVDRGLSGVFFHIVYLGFSDINTWVFETV